MRLAIFGGTFDPIHQGHVTVARTVIDRFGLDRLLLVPAAHPPHKGGATIAGYEDRIRMAELACRTLPQVEVSRLEENTARSYSIDTIAKVRATLPAGAELDFVIGADAFAELSTWRRWAEVVTAVRFLVVSRPGYRPTDIPGAQVESIETLALDVSSSSIRAALSEGKRPAGLPGEVWDYIVHNGLYGVRAVPAAAPPAVP